jgi:glycosyltransferase involved in cell wall biosynthesis
VKLTANSGVQLTLESIKILIFNWRDPKHPQAGGAEKATYEIARRWVQWGHDVHLVSGGFAGGQKTDDVEGIKITRLGGKYSVYLESALHYCRRLKGKFDVIIDETNTVPFFAPLYVRAPHVAFIHQLAANVLFEELPWVPAKSWSFLEPHVLRLYKDTPIITSESTKEDLLKIGIPERNIHVINYGVDHSVYSPGKEKSLFPHVFYLGRLKRFKGVHLLIEAMSQVVKEIPDARLSIVGNGDPDYENELWRLRDSLNLSKNIVFYKYGLDDALSQKVRIMQEAWVLAFPSTREGFGLVVVEANACGTPTVATDVPGLRETVRNGETGIVVPRNVDALAYALKRVLSDTELRTKLSNSALAWSMQFDWEKTSEKMIRVLENTIDSYDEKNWGNKA